MKKFLLFISILSLTFLFTTHKTYAQSFLYNYSPTYLMLAPYNFFLYETEYTNTYEFLVVYMVDGICIENINKNDYFLGNGIGFIKGIDINSNTYEIWHVFCVQEESSRTVIVLEVTVLKSLANSYNFPDNDEEIELLFSRDSALYIRRYSLGGNVNYDFGYRDGLKGGYNSGYITGYSHGYLQGDFDGYSDAGDITYEEGKNAGYNDGFKVGYLEGVEAADREPAYQMGYDDGYNDRRNDRRFKFVSNIYIWIIPAIILVFSLSIFISYRKGRNYNE